VSYDLNIDLFLVFVVFLSFIGILSLEKKYWQNCSYYYQYLLGMVLFFLWNVFDNWNVIGAKKLGKTKK